MQTDGPMRLSLIVSSRQRRGAEVFASELAEALPSRGWEVQFLALADLPPGVEASIPAEALSALEPAALGRLDPKVVRALRSRVLEFGPDVVMANGSSTLQYTVAALRWGPDRPRLVYTSIGDPLFWARGRRRLTYRWLLRLVDHVFSLSGPTGQQLVDGLGLAPSKLTVVPTGVPDRFANATRSAGEAALRVLFAGSLSDEKNPLAALEIVGSAAAAIDLNMTVAGDGPLRDAVAAAADASAVEVSLLGSVSDMTSVYANADVLLLTSRTEGLPGVVLEGAAAGVVTIAYDVGGVREAILDGETGRVVAPGSTEAAAAALRMYGEDRAALTRASDRARMFAGERFTIAAAVDRYDLALRAQARAGEKA